MSRCLNWRLSEVGDRVSSEGWTILYTLPDLTMLILYFSLLFKPLHYYTFSGGFQVRARVYFIHTQVYLFYTIHILFLLLLALHFYTMDKNCPLDMMVLKVFKREGLMDW